MSALAVGFGLAGLDGLVLLHWQERRKIKQMRAAFFSDCLGLFSRYRVVQDHFGYPVLEGCFNGAEIRLEPVLDNVTPRKLPSLWIKVTLLAPVRYRGGFRFHAASAGDGILFAGELAGPPRGVAGWLAAGFADCDRCTGADAAVRDYLSAYAHF